MGGSYTPGPWVYSPKRDTHDSIIHAANAVEEFGYIGPDNGGVVGSSEWIWLRPDDARLIAAAPDLLEALEAVTANTVKLYAAIAHGDEEAGQNFANNDPQYVAAKAAMAKVKGANQ